MKSLMRMLEEKRERKKECNVQDRKTRETTKAKILLNHHLQVSPFHLQICLLQKLSSTPGPEEQTSSSLQMDTSTSYLNTSGTSSSTKRRMIVQRLDTNFKTVRQLTGGLFFYHCKITFVANLNFQGQIPRKPT